MAAPTYAVLCYLVVHATGKAGKYDVESCKFCGSAFHQKGCGRDELTYDLIGRAGSAASSSSKTKANRCPTVLPQQVRDIHEDLGIPYTGESMQKSQVTCDATFIPDASHKRTTPYPNGITIATFLSRP
jgi:hypothetical protein